MAKKPEESVWDYPRPPRVEPFVGLHVMSATWHPGLLGEGGGRFQLLF